MLLPIFLTAVVGLSPATTRQAHAGQGGMPQVSRTWVAQAPPAGRTPPAKPTETIVRPAGGANRTDEFDYDARRKDARFSFEFSKAEVIDVVKAISDMTRQNFVIPEKIKGQRLTILSPTKITAAEAYQVFYTALSSNGISVVRVGKFYKLVDSKESIKDTVPTCIDDEGDCQLYHEQMVTLLMHMRHTDASQVNAVVKALLSKDGDVAIFAPSNAMIISEYAPNLRRVRRIIDALDVPGGDDELQLVQIQYSSAAEVAEKLTQIFEVTGKAGTAAPQPGRPTMAMPGVPPAPSGGNQSDDQDVQISKIVADDRTNQIIIKANKRSFEAIKNLIAKLDVPISETEQGRVHVYYLENAKAEDLSSTLSSLAQGTPSASKKGGAAGTPGGPGIPAQPRPAAGAVETASLFEGDVKITADKATNSLLIMSSAHDYRALRSIIEKLDRPRRQVYVEAAILELNQKETDSVGLNWHGPFTVPNKSLGPLADGANGSITQSIGFFQSAQNSTSPSPTFQALTSAQALLGAAGGALGGLFGPTRSVTLGDGTNFQLPTFGVILKWLETSSNANILSTPHLLTTDNEQAHIEVGNKIPFNTGLFGGAQSALSSLGGSSTTSGASPLGALGGLGGLGALGGFGSVQRIDVSLKLTLTPQINEHNKIRLEIEQTVEDVVGNEARTQQPETAHRALKTVVVVDDQQTIVLGGLMRDKTTDNETKIPILGDIPIIGYLFKQHNDQAEKVNLLLVLTPYIIGSQNDFQRIFERKMQEHEEFAQQYYGHRKEYRAHIDYTKKTGPLGRLVTILRRERGKYENGGGGDGSEIMIEPTDTKSPRGAEPPDTGPDDDAAAVPTARPVDQSDNSAPARLQDVAPAPAVGAPPAAVAPAASEPSPAAPAPGTPTVAPPSADPRQQE